MSLAKGAFYLTISSGMFMLSSYVVNIWLGRSLGPQDYGVYGVVISLMTIINVIQTAGLPQAVSKFVSEGIENPDVILKSALQLQLISTLIISISLFLLSAPISHLLNDVSISPYIKATALILPFYSLYALYSGFYNGQHDFRKQAIMNGVYAISKLILVIAFVKIFRLYGTIFGFIAAPIVALLFGFHWPRSIREFPFKKLIYFSLPLILYAIISGLPIFLDLFLVKSILKDNYLAGLYNATQNIADITFYGMGAFALVLFPRISKLIVQDQTQQAKETIERALRIVIITIVPLVAIIAAGSKQILEILYSQSFSLAAMPLSILAIGIGFLTLFNILANILNGSGKTYYSVGYAVLGIIVITGLGMYLIPKFGLNGAAISTTAGCALSLTLCMNKIRQSHGATINLGSFIKAFVLSGIIFIVIINIPVSNLLMPFFYLGIIILYFYLMYLIKGITSGDLQLVKNILPANLSRDDGKV